MLHTNFSLWCHLAQRFLEIGSVLAERGTGGSGGCVHPQSANSMADSGLSCKKHMVGTGWAISLLLCTSGPRKWSSGHVGSPFLAVKLFSGSWLLTNGCPYRACWGRQCITWLNTVLWLERSIQCTGDSSLSAEVGATLCPAEVPVRIKWSRTWPPGCNALHCTPLQSLPSVMTDLYLVCWLPLLIILLLVWTPNGVVLAGRIVVSRLVQVVSFVERRRVWVVVISFCD